MRQPLPRIVVIVYFCKLFGHSPVYSCILIRVTFIRFSLWLTVKLQIIDYALSCVDREVVILKPRQEEALMHLHNGICCTLAVSTVHVRLQNWSAYQFFSWTVLCWLFHHLCFWWLGRLLAGLQKSSTENSNTVKRLVVFLLCVFPCYVIVWFYGLFYGKMCE